MARGWLRSGCGREGRQLRAASHLPRSFGGPLRPGQAGQLALRGDSTRYPDFEIRNIIANGEVWTGTGEATRALFPAVTTLAGNDFPSENACSIGIRLRYGAFRYFLGGDLPGTPDPGFPAWTAPEAVVAAVVGPVDVEVVSQHGTMGEASDALLAAAQAQVYVIPSWGPSHPAPDTLKRIMNSRYPPARRAVFVTELRPSAKTVIGRRATQLAGPPGHIVIRVEPSGRYSVYVLDNRDDRDLILAIVGPFTSGLRQ